MVIIDTLPDVDVLLKEVLDLQPLWVASNTPEMVRRGLVIRDELPIYLRRHLASLTVDIGMPSDSLGVEGRDGTGLKTEIPWVRIFSHERSPSATTGWYVVYLFDAPGDRVYLSLNQGTTRWNGGAFVARKPEELKARVAWARPLIAAQIANRTDLKNEISLRPKKSKLGRGYELGNVVALEYARDSIPGVDALVQDLGFMAGLLGLIYKAEASASYVPGDLAPEVLEAEEAAAATAGRRISRPRGQGFGLTGDERRAVELHGMRMATEYFESRGWMVRDVSGKESYDLFLERGSEKLHVEVKGTVSMGAQVVLTRAEVEKQRTLSDCNALVVVHSVSLDRTTSPPGASGGILHCVSPWTIEEDDLTPVSYFYRTGL